MLSRRTLRILMVISNRKKIQAEQAAAEASRRLSALDGQAATLSTYMADLGNRMTSVNIKTGYDLMSYGRFIEMGIRARSQNETAIAAGTAAQKVAFDELALETEKQKAIKRTLEQAAAAADILDARRQDHSFNQSAVSNESGNRGRTGRLPPFERQLSNRQI